MVATAYMLFVPSRLHFTDAPAVDAVLVRGQLLQQQQHALYSYVYERVFNVLSARIPSSDITYIHRYTRRRRRRRT